MVGIKEEEVKKVVDLALELFIQSRLNLLGTPPLK
jgi:trigger factor